MSGMERHTTGRVVAPIGEAAPRFQTHGRIRTGQFKKGAKFPTSLTTFRFTSADEEAINALAAVYGGKPAPWNNPKANPPKQFEVVTDSDVVAVKLVPASVKLSYEMWGNGFLRRRCDGVTCFARKPGNPPVESTMPCICNAKQDLKCSPVTRLNVILPGLKFRGVWLLQSNGWNVFAEMPGIAMLLEQQASGQLIDAKLRLTKRIKDGGARQFVVPVIELDQELDELAAGNRAALMAGDTDDEPPAIEVMDPLAALEAGDDDDVVEAEVVDD